MGAQCHAAMPLIIIQLSANVLSNSLPCSSNLNLELSHFCRQVHQLWHRPFHRLHECALCATQGRWDENAEPSDRVVRPSLLAAFFAFLIVRLVFLLLRCIRRKCFGGGLNIDFGIDVELGYGRGDRVGSFFALVFLSRLGLRGSGLLLVVGGFGRRVDETD